MEFGLIAVIIAGWIVALGGLVLIFFGKRKKLKHQH